MSDKFNPLAFAKGVLRRSTKRTKKFNETLANAKYIWYPLNKDGSTSRAYRTSFVCAECTELFDRRQVEVDHIEPIAFSESLEEWIEALYCGDMQVLCKPCHKIKSNSDKKRIAEWKKKRKK